MAVHLEKKHIASIINKVVAEVELWEHRHPLECSHRRDVVVLQWQTLKLCEPIKPRVVNTRNQVIGKWKTLQVRPVGGALYALYAVAI